MMPGGQFDEVQKALLTGYTPATLTLMLRTRLDKVLGNIVAPGSMQDMTQELLSKAEREGWEVDLVREAYRFNPGNKHLFQVYEKYGLAPEAFAETAGAGKQKATVGDEGFEKRIKSRIPDINMSVWREKMALVEPCVCRVEINQRAAGTGFLVGPDAILTNWHVLRKVIEGRTMASAVTCRFDYKLYPDHTRSEGVVVGLHPTEWNQGFSPLSAADGTANLPAPDELDYILVKLARELGNERLNPVAPESPKRGWITIPDPAPTLEPKDPLLIAQHPDGRPLTLAVDTEAVIAVNGNGTRVRYATNTEPGSSGSPCFEMKDWTLVALHHYGDPAVDPPPKYNQGIPIGKIRERIVAQGKAAFLGSAD